MISQAVSLEHLHQQIPQSRPNNFCIAPFQSIRQNPHGRNSPCAFGAGEWHHEHLTPEQRWNSHELNQLRQDRYRDQSFCETFPEYSKLFLNDWNSVTDLSEQNFYRQTTTSNL